MMNDALDRFSEFWVLWRRHMRKSDGRGKARPAWIQMIEAGCDPAEIIDGARWYLRNMSDRDAPYIPLASSWLRSERWADDAEQERAYQSRIAEREEQRQSERDNVVSIGQPRGQTKFLQEFYAQKAAGE